MNSRDLISLVLVAAALLLQIRQCAASAIRAEVAIDPAEPDVPRLVLERGEQHEVCRAVLDSLLHQPLPEPSASDICAWRLQARPEDRIRLPQWGAFDPSVDPKLIMRMRMANFAYRGRHTADEIEVLWESRYRQVWETEQNAGRLVYEIARFDLDRDGSNERVIQVFPSMCADDWAGPGGPRLVVLDREGQVDSRYGPGISNLLNAFLYKGQTHLGYWEINFRWMTGQWSPSGEEHRSRLFATFNVVEPRKPSRHAPLTLSGVVCSVGLYREWVDDVSALKGLNR